MIDDGHGHYIFGTVKVGEKGQIVIPVEAREKFNIKPGDSILILGDITKGLAIPTDKENLEKLFKSLKENM